MADFEEATAAAFRSVFGHVAISGCWFHFTQAVHATMFISCVNFEDKNRTQPSREKSEKIKPNPILPSQTRPMGTPNPSLLHLQLQCIDLKLAVCVDSLSSSPIPLIITYHVRRCSANWHRHPAPLSSGISSLLASDSATTTVTTVTAERPLNRMRLTVVRLT